jgi:hypothetical protein
MEEDRQLQFNGIHQYLKIIRSSQQPLIVKAIIHPAHKPQDHLTVIPSQVIPTPKITGQVITGKLIQDPLLPVIIVHQGSLQIVQLGIPDIPRHKVVQVITGLTVQALLIIVVQVEIQEGQIVHLQAMEVRARTGKVVRVVRAVVVTVQEVIQAVAEVQEVVRAVRHQEVRVVHLVVQEVQAIVGEDNRTALILIINKKFMP